MDKVKLKFKSVSEIVGTEDIGLLIMTDDAETRQLSIPCDKGMLYQFGLRINRVPITHRLLPEVLCQVLSSQVDLKFEIFIHELIDGQYRAMLTEINTLEQYSLRASDAVLLSFISGIPLYIEAELMKKQSVPYHKESRGISIPINTISNEMLNSALDRAIKDENYELASHLRDEINRRKNIGK